MLTKTWHLFRTRLFFGYLLGASIRRDTTLNGGSCKLTYVCARVLPGSTTWQMWATMKDYKKAGVPFPVSYRT